MVDHLTLYDTMVERLGRDDLEEVCLFLGLDPDNYPTEKKPWTLQLVLHMKRAKELDRLALVVDERFNLFEGEIVAEAAARAAEEAERLAAEEAAQAAAEEAAQETTPAATAATSTPPESGAPRREAKQGATTVLFLMANPENTARLRLDEEVREVEKALRLARHGSNLQIKQSPAVKVSTLQDQLAHHDPTIVHFSGHGNSSSELMLEDEQGQAQAVPRAALSELFGLLQERVRCVVLNACYSQAQAKDIALYVDCVVGTTTALDDQTAIHFSQSFYRALADGRSVADAFKWAKNNVGLNNLPDSYAQLLDPRNKAATLRFA